MHGGSSVTSASPRKASVTADGIAGSARRIAVVAGLTFREAWQRKMIIAAVVMSAGYLALYGLALHFASQDTAVSGHAATDALMENVLAAQLLYVGLFPASLIVGLTAVFASVAAISSDLDTGLLHGVLVRPIRRTELLVGKALGIGLMLVLHNLAFMSALIGLARWLIGAPVANVPTAMALLTLSPLALLGLAMLGTTRLPTLANGVLCATAYGISFVGGFIEQIGSAIENETMVNLGIISSLLLPADAMYRKAIEYLLPGGLLLLGGGGGSILTPAESPSVWM
ncbi:MAG: ABC transporter permease subunit, partial [Actinobacteria bacterium]|nr:ABC transporter permease subunit [Actinomycetota bacterium]